LLETDDPNAIRPVAAELPQAIRDRIDTVRQDFVDIALIDRMMDMEGIPGESRNETSS
jgi:hypothetical protein